jgi:hypothetical protein
MPITISVEKAVITSFRESDKGRQWIELCDGDGKLMLTSVDVDMRKVERLTPVKVLAIVRPDVWSGGKQVLEVLDIKFSLVDGKNSQ